MPNHPLHIAGARHDVERAVDGERHNGQLDVVGEHEGSALEDTHMSCERACPLGEHHERHATLQRLSGAVVGLAYLACATLVDEDVMSRLARLANERHLA